MQLFKLKSDGWRVLEIWKWVSGSEIYFELEGLEFGN